MDISKTGMIVVGYVSGLDTYLDSKNVTRYKLHLYCADHPQNLEISVPDTIPRTNLIVGKLVQLRLSYRSIPTKTGSFRQLEVVKIDSVQ